MRVWWLRSGRGMGNNCVMRDSQGSCRLRCQFVESRGLRGFHSPLSDPSENQHVACTRQDPNKHFVLSYFMVLFFLKMCCIWLFNYISFFFSQVWNLSVVSLHAYMCVLSSICPSLIQHPYPPMAPSFHGGTQDAAAKP